MRKRKETVFKEGGIEFRVGEGVHPVITRTVVQAAREEQRTLIHRLARIVGRKVERVDIRNKRGGSNKKSLGRLCLSQRRMIVYAGNIEDLAEAAGRKNLGRNWGRQIAADEITRHEIRHLITKDESRVRQYSKRKTRQKHGGHLIG